MTDQMGARNAQRIQKAEHVGCEVGHANWRLRRVAGTVAPAVRGDQPVAGECRPVEERQHAVGDEARVQEKNGLARTVLVIGDQLVIDADGLDGHAAYTPKGTTLGACILPMGPCRQVNRRRPARANSACPPLPPPSSACSPRARAPATRSPEKWIKRCASSGRALPASCTRHPSCSSNAVWPAPARSTSAGGRELSTAALPKAAEPSGRGSAAHQRTSNWRPSRSCACGSATSAQSMISKRPSRPCGHKRRRLCSMAWKSVTHAWPRCRPNAVTWLRSCTGSYGTTTRC